MKIYFGQVDSSNDTTGTEFQHNGKQFYYCAEYGTNPGGTEDVLISDSIGRMLPVDISALSDMIATLNQVLVTSAVVELARETVDEIENGDTYFSI